MNKNELISYNDYYFDKYEYTQIGIGPNSLHVDQPANDIEKFFFKSTTCPFCGTILKEVFHGSQSDSIGIGSSEPRTIKSLPPSPDLPT